MRTHEAHLQQSSFGFGNNKYRYLSRECVEPRRGAHNCNYRLLSLGHNDWTTEATGGTDRCGG